MTHRSTELQRMRSYDVSGEIVAAQHEIAYLMFAYFRFLRILLVLEHLNNNSCLFVLEILSLSLVSNGKTLRDWRGFDDRVVSTQTFNNFRKM